MLNISEAQKEERELQYSQEAERILIGQVLQNHENFYLNHQDSLKPEDFYNTFYREVYKAVQGLFSATGKIDFAAIAQKVGRKAYELATLIDDTFIYRSLSWPLEKTLVLSQKRRMLEGLYRVNQKIKVEDDISAANEDLQGLILNSRREKGFVYDGTATANSIFDRQELRQKSKEDIEGIRTGFNTIDKDLDGLGAKKMTLLSAIPGTGKTSMSINWLAEIGVRQAIPSLFVSLEMQAADVHDRLLSILSGIRLNKIKAGAMDNTLEQSLSLIKNSPLYISDNYPRNIFDICGLVERHAISKKVEFVVLDYIGEICRDNAKDEARDERFARWVKSLRDLCKRHDLHILIICQVNSEGHLAESKKMGHIADAWLHLYLDGGRYALECRKNRFGPVGRRYHVFFNLYNQQMNEQGLIDNNEGYV